MTGVRELLPPDKYPVKYCASPYEVGAGAHAVLVLTEWDEFRKLDLSRLRAQMDVPVLLDGRNIYDPEAARAAGFEYLSVGR
jgi:UDPglucose 6-dehydrogenase